jgi:hypothetical protein
LKIRDCSIPETGGFVMTELRPANVIGVLRIARASFALRSFVSVPGVSLDNVNSKTGGASFAVGPPR